MKFNPREGDLDQLFELYNPSVEERLGPSYFFISFVLGPLNSLLRYVPSSRYVWSSAPILFLQEQ